METLMRAAAARRHGTMAGKRGKKGKAKKSTPKKAKKGKPRAAARRAPKRASGGEGELVHAVLHDMTNLATAVRAYLELLISQGTLEERQRYYVDRAREQVEMMIDAVRELREKMG